MSTLRTNTLSNAAGSASVPVDTVISGSAKARVNFNGTFGSSPFTIANGGIRAAFNVSSITDNGTGDYTVNFTTAMVDANYAFTTSFGGTNSSFGFSAFDQATPRTASAFRVVGYNAAGSVLDMAQINISVFR